MTSSQTPVMDPAALSMLNRRALAQEQWRATLKKRAMVLRAIETLRKRVGEEFELEQLEKLEGALAEFRLGFILTFKADPGYVFEENLEEVLWKLHIFFNMTYRELVLHNFRGHEHTVTRRKVEKSWCAFLKTASLFYKKTYFQHVQDIGGMPQIPRVNRALGLSSSTSTAAQDGQVSPVAIKKAFHSTLLHLGDISRYYAKARSKSGRLSSAVLYYELAHSFEPTSGLAHHQLAILEDSNHLLVVYHLYRAAAIETPHPNALSNLAQEFRKLSSPSQPRRSVPLDFDSAFADWFSKLHAYLYKGDTYPRELEEEVLHRLETALKKPNALSLVLKMVLTNIAAYYIAKAKIQKEWSLKASSSCQFILQLNVRWIVVLARLLQTELQDFAKSAALAKEELESGHGEREKSPARSSIFTDTILPLTRIYLAWLYIHRTDLVDYQDHLGPYIFEMYQALASTLTMMANEFNNGVVASSPYLLAEDVEALGLKPFDDVTLPPACRLHHELDKVSFKPHWEDRGGPRNPPEQEMLSRVYDWINCGFALALDERFPLSISAKAGKGIAVVYLEGGKPLAPAQAATVLEQANGQLPPQTSRPAQRADETLMGGLDGHSGDSRLPSAALPQPSFRRDSPTINDLLEAEPNSGIKQRMRSLVDDLLDGDRSDANPESERSASGMRKASSGTHSSATAGDLGIRPTSTLQASAMAFSPSSVPQRGFDQFDKSRKRNDVGPGKSGSRNSSFAHSRQRLGGSMDSFYSGGSPYLPGSPKVDGHGPVASGTTQPDGRVDSVSPPIFGFNSTWTSAFDPNASSLPPVNSPWGLPGAQPRVQSRTQSVPQSNGAIAPRDAPAEYQHYSAAQRFQTSTTVSNGRAYDGSTAYGRGNVATTSDPSYFRNAVQGLKIADALPGADAYDQAVMRSAFTPKR